MIVTILTFLWCLFIVVIVVMLLYHVRSSDSQHYIFQNYNEVGLPFVTIDIQGQPLNLIVDSGAAVSLITQEALKLINYEPCGRKIDICATTAETLPADMITIPIIVNGREIKEDFVIHSVEDLANFKVMHNLTAHGILGNEFFEKTGCKIDYKKHSVTLH